jgi:hypothetical protein
MESSFASFPILLRCSRRATYFVKCRAPLLIYFCRHRRHRYGLLGFCDYDALERVGARHRASLPARQECIWRHHRRRGIRTHIFKPHCCIFTISFIRPRWNVAYVTSPSCELGTRVLRDDISSWLLCSNPQFRACCAAAQ